VAALPGMWIYLLALALTLLIEVPVYGLMLHAFAGARWRDAARQGLVANLISHPTVFLLVTPLLAPRLGRTSALAVAEILAVAIEAAVVQLIRRQDGVVATGTAYVANAVSFCAGLVVLAG
jgi:hypothetical protein